MTTNVKPSALASRVSVGLPTRWTGRFANPIGNVNQITRETAPLASNAPARVQHPKLNTSPWSTSMAVKRKALPAKASKNVRVG
jgi:hypothetical protein